MEELSQEGLWRQHGGLSPYENLTYRGNRLCLCGGGKCILKDIKALVQLLIGDTEWHEYAQDVVVRASLNQYQAPVVRCGQYVAGCVRIWFFISLGYVRGVIVCCCYYWHSDLCHASELSGLCFAQ